MEKRRIRVKLPLIIYMFLLLFAPPVIKDVNLLLILFIFSLIAILFKYRNQLKEVLLNRNIKKILFIILLYFIWYFATIILNGVITKEWYLYNYFINMYSMALVFPIVTVCCLHIILYAKKNEISFNEIIEIIIISGLIQGAFTILACIFPQFKKLLLEIMYHNTGEKLYVHNYSIERRFFGFANNLLDSFGFGTGIIAIIPLFYSIRNGKKWMITVPILLLVPLLNSRTGLVIFTIGFVCWCAYIIKERKITEYKRIVVITAIALTLIIAIIKIIFPTTMQWIINDFSSFFSNKKGTADILFSSNFWKMPEKIHILFGTGYNIAAFGGMKEIIGITSDVGYINEIWKTGMIGLILKLFMLGAIVKYAIKNATKEYQYFIIYLVIAVLIANIKFSVFSYSPGIVIITIITLLLILKNKTVNKQQELISVIVPIYNVENYLKCCLNSIINQTYKNIEIILVNDGSTDTSGSICEEFLKKDKRIRYIFQENQGLSATRNRGMQESNSNYYIFIDSDDYINIHFIEELYNTMISTNADIAICGYMKVFEGKEYDIQQKEENSIEVFEGKRRFNNLYNNKKTITTVAWNKLYKKELFSDIKYPVGKIHEDEFVIYDILNVAKRVAYTSCNYYYYLQRKSSITGSYNSKRGVILEALYNRLQKVKDKRIYACTLYNYYYQLIYQSKMLKKYCPEKKEIIDDIYKEIISYKKEILLNIYINPLKKLKIMLKLHDIK